MGSILDSGFSILDWGRGRRYLATGVLILASCSGLHAAEPVRWTGTDIAGQEVVVPMEESATVMVFVRPGQMQSGQLLRELRGLLGDPDRRSASQASSPAWEGVGKMRVIVVVSGAQAAEQARGLGDTAAGWQVVTDAEYELSGRMSVHVWPMTVLIDGQGAEQARLSGLPRSYTTDLQAHLEHVAGKIDRETLEQRLATRQVVADENGPAKRLQMAEQLLHRGQLEPAREALREAVEQIGEDPASQLRAARLLAMLGEPGEAIAMLDRIEPGRLPPWQVHVVRARALIQQGEWEAAKQLLPEAMKLNPNPGEAHYLQGLVHEHEGDWQSAAESFREAFEAAVPGQKLE